MIKKDCGTKFQDIDIYSRTSIFYDYSKAQFWNQKYFSIWVAIKTTVISSNRILNLEAKNSSPAPTPLKKNEKKKKIFLWNEKKKDLMYSAKEQVCKILAKSHNFWSLLAAQKTKTHTQKTDIQTFSNYSSTEVEN